MDSFILLEGNTVKAKMEKCSLNRAFFILVQGNWGCLLSPACNGCWQVDEELCTKDFELGFQLDAFLLQEDVKPKNKKHNIILRSMWLLSPRGKLYHCGIV